MYTALHFGQPGLQARPAQKQLQGRLQCSRPPRGSCGVRCAANGTQQEAAAPRRQAGSSLASPPDEADDVYDIVAAARRKTAKAALPADAPPQRGPVKDFLSKCAAAYRIFFPPQQRNLSPKELGRNRLRMILVADRCAMNPASLSDMKASIVSALSNYVEVEDQDDVEVNVTTDEDLGTIYSVAVPVKRVKATARLGLNEDSMEGLEAAEWDEEDPEADPSSRFPFGT